MGKLRQTALILGEGPTEFFYFKSLCDVFKRLTIKPDYPKHTSIKELDLKISEGVAMGYNHIFCIIDMDTKDVEPERSQYQRLKTKYAKPINKPKKGISTLNATGGSLEKAIANASRSMDEVQKEGRDYTFSELGRLMKRLTTLSE